MAYKVDSGLAGSIVNNLGRRFRRLDKVKQYVESDGRGNMSNFDKVLKLLIDSGMVSQREDGALKYTKPNFQI